MNDLHDDALRTALAEGAARFTIPREGIEHILVAASRPAKRAPHEHTGEQTSGWSRRRLALIAAVVIVLAVLAGSLSLAGLGHVNNNPTRLAAGAPAHGGTANGAPLGQASFGESSRNQSAVTHSWTGQTPSSNVPAVQQTKVVSVGTISISVAGNDVASVLTRISTLAASVGGYVASSKSTAGNQSATRTSGTIVVRIPQKQFASVVAKTERLGHVVSAVSNSTDVTSEFVDYQSRIGALDSSRAQYLAIMARASSIGDVLAIQAQLNVIESQIEQLEGQRNLLVNQAAFGTLTVDINQGAAAPSRPSGVLRAWHQSISGFVAGVEWIIQAAGPALFALLCLAVLLLLGRFGWRASQRRLI